MKCTDTRTTQVYEILNTMIGCQIAISEMECSSIINTGNRIYETPVLNHKLTNGKVSKAAKLYACVSSGFRRDVNEIYFVLEFYAA